MAQSCKSNESKETVTDSAAVASVVTKTTFEKTADGREIFAYTLKNKNNVQLTVINYGGTITSLLVPDKHGVLEDVVLGFDSLSGYANNPFYGSIIGRFGNRIGEGTFTLDGKQYTLAQNNNGQHLHGGIKGFDKAYWEIEETPASNGQALKLTYQSKDMEEGYPGNLQVEVIYTLTNENELKIDYKATTDKKTIINLTNHSYFNLTGNVKRDVLDHQVMLYAHQFVPVDKTLIATGELKDVTNTPFDFRSATAIGARINDKDEQLENAQGYDHTWVLGGTDSLKLAASVYEPLSGRAMEVFTTEPGVQFYTGNFMKGSLGKGNIPYPKRYGFCLETQHFPDSPNKPQFPSVILNPGETYTSETIYHFFTR
jgi:aldose 1-epimerase